MNTDIPATIIDWAGVEVPATYQGQSLKPIVDGDTVTDWRTDFFCEHVVLAPTLTWEGVRDQRYVYARYYDQEPLSEFLHDLDSDPDQLKNFVADPAYAAVLVKMRERCDELVQKYGGPMIPMDQRPSTIYGVRKTPAKAQ